MEDIIQIGILLAILWQGYVNRSQLKHLKNQFHFEQEKLKHSFKPLLTIEVKFIDGDVVFGEEVIKSDELPIHKVKIKCHRAPVFNVFLKASETVSNLQSHYFQRVHPIVLNAGEVWEFDVQGHQFASKGHIATITYNDSFNNAYKQEWTFRREAEVIHKLELPLEFEDGINDNNTL